VITKKLLNYASRMMTLAILLSPFAVLSPAEAQPEGVPKERCGTLSNPTPGTLCYMVTPGGGKVNAHGDPRNFPTVIQPSEHEYVVADIVIEVTSAAGDISYPTVNQLSIGSTLNVVRQAQENLRELKSLKADLEQKASVLYGPASIEAQAKLSALQEQERNYEYVVTTTMAAGKDAAKFEINASARSRCCGWGCFDTCGSWVHYNIYVVKRYVGDPIAAYNKPREVAQDAQRTIFNLVEQSKQN